MDTPEIPTAPEPRSDATRLYLLAGLSATVLVLALVVLRRPRVTTATDAVRAALPDGWEASLEHFAGAVDLRFQGLEEHLTKLAGTVTDLQLQAMAAGPPTNVVTDTAPSEAPATAAVSLPPAEPEHAPTR